MSIMDRLALIEARAASATEAPWVAYPSDRTPGISHIDIPGSMHPTAWPADAGFIAAARTDVPDLVAAVRVREQALQAALDVCEKSELGWYPESKYDEYVPGQLDTAERIRDAITAALGDAS